MTTTNYFQGYKAKSNRDNDLRWYSHGKSKRLYVTKKLVGKYIIARTRANDETIIVIDTGTANNGLKVNNQGFVSLNRLEDETSNTLFAKSLVYSDRVKKLVKQ